jgi:hypothetical protein
MLTLLILIAKKDGQITSLVPHLVDEGLSTLQYADNTILFMDHDIEQAKTWNYYYVFLSNYQV